MRHKQTQCLYLCFGWVLFPHKIKCKKKAKAPWSEVENRAQTSVSWRLHFFSLHFYIFVKGKSSKIKIVKKKKLWFLKNLIPFPYFLFSFSFFFNSTFNTHGQVTYRSTKPDIYVSTSAGQGGMHDSMWQMGACHWKLQSVSDDSHRQRWATEQTHGKGTARAPTRLKSGAPDTQPEPSQCGYEWTASPVPKRTCLYLLWDFVWFVLDKEAAVFPVA